MPVKIIPRALALAVAVLAMGCMFHTPGLSKQRHILEKELPGARFDRTIGLKFGRMSLSLARSILNKVEDEDEDVDRAMTVLRHLNGVQVALYRTVDLPWIDTRTFKPPRGERLEAQGWYLAADVRGEDHVAWAHARNDSAGFVREILVGALDDEQLVLVRVRGNVQRIFEQLVEENELDLPGMIHADLDPAEGEPLATVEDDAAPPASAAAPSR